MEILNFKFSLLFTKMWNHRTIFVFNNGGLCFKTVCQFVGMGSIYFGVCAFLEYKIWSIHFFL